MNETSMQKRRSDKAPPLLTPNQPTPPPPPSHLPHPTHSRGAGPKLLPCTTSPHSTSNPPVPYYLTLRLLFHDPTSMPPPPTPNPNPQTFFSTVLNPAANNPPTTTSTTTPPRPHPRPTASGAATTTAQPQPFTATQRSLQARGKPYATPAAGEAYETRQQREQAANILSSTELLLWYSAARNEVIVSPTTIQFPFRITQFPNALPPPILHYYTSKC